MDKNWNDPLKFVEKNKLEQTLGISLIQQMKK